MKKLLIIFSMIVVLFIAGCAGTSNDEQEKAQGNGVPETEETEDENGSEDYADVDDMVGELSLQVLKEDEEAGIKIDNNELYQVLQAEIEANPLMGDPDDLSLFPYDIVEYEDGSAAILFLVINRLEHPIENLFMVLTFGNDEGDYIFDAISVDLVEEYMGVLEVDGVIPIFLQVEAKDVDLFYTLDPNNLLLEMGNFKTAFVE